MSFRIMRPRTYRAVDLVYQNGDHGTRHDMNFLFTYGRFKLYTDKRDLFNVLLLACNDHPGEIVYQMCYSILQSIRISYTVDPRLCSDDPQERCDNLMQSKIVSYIDQCVQADLRDYFHQFTADLELIHTGKILLNNFLRPSSWITPEQYGNGMATFHFLTFFQFEYTFNPVQDMPHVVLPMRTCQLMVAVDTEDSNEMTFYFALSCQELRALLRTRYSCREVCITKQANIDPMQYHLDTFHDVA